MKNASAKKPFGKHLAELRTRLIWVVAIFLVGSIVGYAIADPILRFLLSPLHQSVYYTSPVGGFNVIMTICFLIGSLFAIPMLVYQLFAFVQPLLRNDVEEQVPLYILSATVLMLLGSAFAYFVALPSTLHFLSGFASNDVKAMITANTYLSFVVKYFIGFSIIFQLPLVFVILNSIKPLSLKKILHYQKFVIVAALIFGAILSPDPVNMLLMGVPIIILYYFSLGLIWFINRYKLQQK